MHENIVKEILLERDPDFKELYLKHYKYKKELNNLDNIIFKSHQEIIKCKDIKRKKLILKDQMQALIGKYKGQI